MESIDQVNSRVPSLTFKTSAVWGATPSGTLSAEGRPAVMVSSPPEFNGGRGCWSPEELFVGSIEMCHMNTFMSTAARCHVPIMAFQSHANGVLEYVDGVYRFTRIVIFPTVTIGPDVIDEDVHVLLRETERHCLLTNSIASVVEINPTIVVR